MCTEILSLVNCFIEVPGRKLEKNTFWSQLENVTTVIEEESTDKDKQQEESTAAAVTNTLFTSNICEQQNNTRCIKRRNDGIR